MTYRPKEVVDPHHHFLDTPHNAFQGFLRSVAGDDTYLPEDYARDVVAPLAEVGVRVGGTVHVEAMPDEGVAEVAWVERLAAAGRCDYVKGYVASANLTDDNIKAEIRSLVAATPQLRGIRWILDCVGKFAEGGATATHVATRRHDGIDYLAKPEFERGLALLEKYDLSFDLQCAPIQLVTSAAALMARHPNVKVCIDHLGKPRKVLGDDLSPDGNVNPNVVPDERELATWRQGMTAMAALPHVYVKISMLGYACPGWIRTKERQELVKALVRETVALFGARRCMVAWNWHVNGAVSDTDNLSSVGPDSVQLLEKFLWFFEGYSVEDRDRLFAGTAKEFYRIG